MSKVLVAESSLESIADAIRTKNGTENTYKPGQMAAAIEALPGQSTLVSKSITQNGSYDPEDDDADGYSAVTVNVPNSYAAGDEGKVVSNGALVAQTARASEITANGTYDTTTNNEVTVNVAGGGSGDFIKINPDYQGLAYSYISTDGRYFQNTGEGKNIYSSYFHVTAGQKVVLFVGETVSDRLRVHFYAGKTFSDFVQYVENEGPQTAIYTSTNNISGTGELSGQGLVMRFIFTASADGEIVVVTSRTSVTAPVYLLAFTSS